MADPISKAILVSGGFDDLRSKEIRFLEEASRLGELSVVLWSDATLRRQTGKDPKFREAERQYLLQSIRYVGQVKTADVADPNSLPLLGEKQPDVWVVHAGEDNPERKRFCETRGIALRALGQEHLGGFPELPATPSPAGRKKVVVTGCYDWFHSGHVRFFEEVSAYGDLYVVVGHDANVKLLKGPHHPMHHQEERRYLVGAVRFVKQALVSTGSGWLDAEPEIEQIQPDIYAVNEDGDKGGKREFCEKHDIEYLVLKRTPAPGLPQRSSTDLRGF